MFKAMIENQIKSKLSNDHDIFVDDNSIFSFKDDGRVFIDWEIDNASLFVNGDFVDISPIGFVSADGVTMTAFRYKK